MNRLFATFLFLFFISPLFSQIVIDQGDMPSAGDTLRVSMTNDIQGDYLKSGPNQVWDFSGLSKISQQVISYVSATNTPSVYWYPFIPNVVFNLSSPGQTLNAFPGLPFTDFYQFYKNSSTQFADAGFAFQMSGIPIAMKYNNPEVYYTFPCKMGSQWNSNSLAVLSLPGFAYASTERSRNSEVDGWGLLKIPMGSYQTLRIKSVVVESDSLYLDTLGTGVPIVRTITEYKWLAKGEGIPLLQVSEEGPAKTVTYRDVVSQTGIHELRREFMVIHPNPASGRCRIDLSGVAFPASLQILDLNGKIVRETELNSSHGQSLTMDISNLLSGLYFIKLVDKFSVKSGKLIIDN